MFHRRHVSRVGSFIKGVVVGGLVLGISALLWAPKKGLQLRRELKRGAHNVLKKAKATKNETKKAARRIRK